MSDSPESIVRSYLAAFNDRDWSSLRSHLHPDAVEHGIHDTLHGPDEIVPFLEGHFEAFPDYTGETEALLVSDDVVTVRYTARGTHTGEYKGVEPTGLPASWTGISMYRVADGAVAEIWVEEDRLGLLEQLEMIETSEPAHLRL